MLPALNGATRIHVTIGDPIAQVKSPAGITQGFASRGKDAIMIPLQVKPADIEDFFRLAKKLPNLDGIVITVPHKPVAFRHCDTTTERSRVLEVCNVMRRESDGRWTGDMTDGGGFVGCAQALRLRSERPSARCRSARAGLARRIALSLCMEGATRFAVSISIPSQARCADRAARAVTATRSRQPTRPIPTGFDLVVNATPAGMRDGDPLPVDVAKLDGKMFVADIITMPLLTPLLAAAQAKGCGTQNGRTCSTRRAISSRSFCSVRSA